MNRISYPCHVSYPFQGPIFVDDLRIDFEWPVSSYQITATPAEPGGVETLPGVGLLAGMQYTRPAVPEGPKLLTSLSKPKLVQPDRKRLGLVVGVLLQATDDTLEDRILAVSQKVGMLSQRSDIGAEESLLRWQALCGMLHLVFNAESIFSKHVKSTGGPIGQADMVLLPDSSRKPRIALRPRTLADALIYTAARMKAGGVDVHRCELCSKPMLIGGNRNAAGSRADARFCSDRCRTAFHNARRRNG